MLKALNSLGFKGFLLNNPKILEKLKESALFRLILILFLQEIGFHLVARGGIEPPTRGFSVRCSTN